MTLSVSITILWKMKKCILWKKRRGGEGTTTLSCFHLVLRNLVYDSFMSMSFQCPIASKNSECSQRRGKKIQNKEENRAFYMQLFQSLNVCHCLFLPECSIFHFSWNSSFFYTICSGHFEFQQWSQLSPTWQHLQISQFPISENIHFIILLVKGNIDQASSRFPKNLKSVYLFISVYKCSVSRTNNQLPRGAVPKPACPAAAWQILVCRGVHKFFLRQGNTWGVETLARSCQPSLEGAGDEAQALPGQQ